MTTQAVEVAQANVPPAAAAARAAGKVRFLYLDNLRMAVITFVVLMHTAIIYGAMGDWYYRETGETGTLFSIIAALLGGIGTAFVMGLLFLIAGYFTPRSYDRKGAGHFLLDRLKRLGLPLLFYEVVINRRSTTPSLFTMVIRIAGAVVGRLFRDSPASATGRCGFWKSC